MADFLYGMRRALGLTSPQEDADMAERERVTREQASRFNPGVALRERQETLDALIPVQATTPPVPMRAAPVQPQTDFSAPRYGETAEPALRALEGYGVRSNINPAIPSRRPEDEELRRRPAQGGVRG